MNGNRQAARSDGVALIIVLSMLAIVSLVMVAFLRSTRDERLAARNSVDLVRARHLVPVGLIRALEEIDRRMVGYGYPSQAVVCSTGIVRCADILEGPALAAVPGTVRSAALAATGNCYWTSIVTPGGATNGRVAYLVVNCSGLLDANIVGGADRTGSTHVSELDLSGLPDMQNDEDFYVNRQQHRRYETIAELAELNPGALANPVSNLFIYSYDPGRDTYFTNSQELGTRTIGLTNKFCVNRLTNESFRAEYWSPLIDLLLQAGLSNNTEAVAWNLVDYLDSDRIPAGPASCEAVPLINEIVLQQDPLSNTNYWLTVELWFPFAPACVTPADAMSVRIEVSVTNPAVTIVSNNVVDYMEFGNTSNEFLLYSNKFATTTTNAISAANPVHFVVQVRAGTTGVVGQVEGHIPTNFTLNESYSVDDPRVSPWERMSSNTLGRMNANCDPWAVEGSGLPVMLRDGPMASIGELGDIYYPDPARPWHTIDLMAANEGAALLDWMTVRTTNTGTHGLVNIGTDHTNVLIALFHNEEIGFTNGFCTNRYRVADSDIRDLARAFANYVPPISFHDMFATSSVATAFANCAPLDDTNHTIKGELREAVFRQMVEMVTFRQNLFTVIVAVQVLAPDGTTPVAERRAVAVVYRDAYTGKRFTRSFRWLEE